MYRHVYSRLRVCPGAEDIFYNDMLVRIIIIIIHISSRSAVFTVYIIIIMWVLHISSSSSLGPGFDCYRVKTLLTAYKICAEDSRNVTFKVFSR